ncbi:MAG: pantetheine-phosphate adenylyltransferase [Patescibacteria group bacterium]|nr:pantetheine-phosphate adenylyltransferase [Patescibacteria group bacterium]
MKFTHSIVAGTFDHLHLGHQKLLNSALQNSLKVSIGLTQKKLYQKKTFSNLIESQTKRFNTLKKFLKPKSSFNIFSLTNPLEPAASSTTFDSIISSTATLNTVKQINQIRLQNNLKPLKTTTINLVKSSDKKSLSSTRIRQGRINRLGYAYHQVFPKNKKLTLPPIHRHSLKKPFGLLLEGSLKTLDWASLKAKEILKQTPPTLTIAVGDIATLSLLNQKVYLNLAIIDLKTKRQPFFNSPKQLGLPSISNYTVNNPPSTITPDLINALQTSLKNYGKKQSILVKGEEDLSVLPSILLSPLNTAIFYGQPNKGLVYIKVTETSKQKALLLLQKLI